MGSWRSIPTAEASTEFEPPAPVATSTNVSVVSTSSIAVAGFGSAAIVGNRPSHAADALGSTATATPAARAAVATVVSIASTPNAKPTFGTRKRSLLEQQLAVRHGSACNTAGVRPAAVSTSRRNGAAAHAQGHWP